jgi:hypothetical protein
LNFPSLDEVMDRLSSGESPRRIIASLREMLEEKKNR